MVDQAVDKQLSVEMFSIGSVVEELRRSYPDVSHSSLRFLEREGLIVPVRTPGGHRLFTAEHVARIRLIKEWQAKHLSLAEIRERLQAAPPLDHLDEISTRFLQTAIGGHRGAATRLLLDLDDSGVSLVQIFSDVLLPALVSVGQQWEEGDLAVGQEKEISELARDIIADLSQRHADPDPHGPVVVAACVAGERHDIGLRMIVALLREQGWRVHFLGADVDARFLAESVALRDPAVVLLSATTAERLPSIKDAVAALNRLESSHALPIVIGGRGSAAHREIFLALGAISAGEDGLASVLDVLAEQVQARQSVR